jgi:hypothetical protein
MFHSGEKCSCIAIVCNQEGHTLEGYPLFVLLEVFGSFFFAPSYNQTFDNYLIDHPIFSPGETRITVLPEFDWPDITGSADGIKWYGAMTDPQMTKLTGTLGVFNFGWE